MDSAARVNPHPAQSAKRSKRAHLKIDGDTKRDRYMRGLHAYASPNIPPLFPPPRNRLVDSPSMHGALGVCVVMRRPSTRIEEH